jgi:hypothetical protein
MGLDRLGTLTALVLAAVFLVAAVAKLRDPMGTTRTFRALRLPAPRRLARLVPGAELLIAAALVARPWIGAAVALAALAVFSILLHGEVRRGSDVACGCFGTSSSSPISFVELLRNGLLAALAVVALAAERPVAPDLASVITVSTAVVAGLLILALAGVKRDVGAVWDNRLAGEMR